MRITCVLPEAPTRLYRFMQTVSSSAEVDVWSSREIWEIGLKSHALVNSPTPTTFRAYGLDAPEIAQQVCKNANESTPQT